jgi:hypothetical protein
VRTYNCNGKYFALRFLEHLDNEDSAVVSSDYEGRVVNGGVYGGLSDLFLRKEELKLVVVEVYLRNYRVKVD